MKNSPEKPNRKLPEGWKVHDGSKPDGDAVRKVPVPDVETATQSFRHPDAPKREMTQDRRALFTAAMKRVEEIKRKTANCDLGEARKITDALLGVRPDIDDFARNVFAVTDQDLENSAEHYRAFADALTEMLADEEKYSA